MLKPSKFFSLFAISTLVLSTAVTSNAEEDTDLVFYTETSAYSNIDRCFQIADTKENLKIAINWTISKEVEQVIAKANLDKVPAKKESVEDLAFAGFESIDTEELGEIRGTFIGITDNDSVAVAISEGLVAGNKVIIGEGGSLQTGANGIANGAFNGVSGLVTTIQNSGNNVLIQNNTVVNYNGATTNVP
jgi:hypothetical protein